MSTFPPPITRDLPDPPRNLWRIVGPGIVAAGVGLSSGEFVLWPYIASQVGLVFIWGALVGVGMQFFLNMEIERYALATGETAITGFNRIWKHWGLVLAIMVYLSNLWPGWALSSATLLTYLFGGGSPPVIAAVSLLVIGASLTLAPVVYVALERFIFVKVLAVGVLAVLAVVFAIDRETWTALPNRSAPTCRSMLPSSVARWSTPTAWPTSTKRPSTGARGWAPCWRTRRSRSTGAPSGATSPAM